MMHTTSWLLLVTKRTSTLNFDLPFKENGKFVMHALWPCSSSINENVPCIRKTNNTSMSSTSTPPKELRERERDSVK